MSSSLRVMNLVRDVARLERKMIPPERWDEVPSHIIDIVHEEIEQGYPIGFTYDEDLGWCILATGQGPFLVYAERET